MKFKQGNKFEGEDMIFDEDKQNDCANFGDIEFYLNGDNNWKDVKLNGKFNKIPKEWIIDNIENLCDIHNNLRKPISSSVRIIGNYPYYGSTGIQDKLSEYSIEGRHLLIGEDGANWSLNGKDTSFIVNGKFNVNNHAHIITSEEILLDLINLQLNTTNLDYYVTGGVIRKLTKANLLSINLIKYDKLEQSKIACVLTSQQDYIDELQTQKANKIKEKQYFTQEELSGRLRIRLTNISIDYCLSNKLIEPLPEGSGMSFKATTYDIIDGMEKEFGDWLSNGFDDKVEFYLNEDDNWKDVKIDGLKITKPKDWDSKEIKKLGKVITGKTPPTTVKEFWGGDFPWYTTPNFQNGKLLESHRKLTIKGKKKTPLIPVNSTLITCIGEIGQTVLTEHLCGINQQINAVSAYDTTNYLFLYYLLSNSTSTIKHFSEKVVVPMLKKSAFEKIKLIVPKSKLEQTLISTHLTMYDDLIDDLDTKINIEEKKLKYLTNELLSGRLRVR
jgi:restriction endonuclease S subunit